MNDVEDAEVQALREARGSAAELKARFVTLRSDLPNGLIFVFEGDDDRGIYLSWIRQIDASLKYEPFSCGGKTGVLRLWDALSRDVNNLKESTYFFVDRDFDDLRGRVADSSVFMTEYYSVENYLVNSDVLDHILKIEFHCHAKPAIRRDVITLFERVYDDFVAVTGEYNRDLHVTRLVPLELKKSLPKTVRKLAVVELESIASSGVPVTDVIVSDPLVDKAARDMFRADFDGLEGRTRYRGKFNLLFFRSWLDKLASERKNEASSLFAGLRKDVKVATDRLTLATLAARSDPPTELAGFLDSVTG